MEEWRRSSGAHTTGWCARRSLTSRAAALQSPRRRPPLTTRKPVERAGLLHRHLAHDHVVAGLAAALRAGALTADAVALEARKAAELEDPVAGGASAEPGTPEQVASLTRRRLAHLPPDPRPLPSIAVYDQLLRRRTTTGTDEEGTTGP